MFPLRNDIIFWIYENYFLVLLYLVLGGILCTIFKKYCPAMSKKEEEKLHKISTKNLFLNRIDIIGYKVYIIMAIIIIGLGYFLVTFIGLFD
jgi:hypothetical protein